MAQDEASEDTQAFDRYVRYCRDIKMLMEAVNQEFHQYSHDDRHMFARMVLKMMQIDEAM